MSPAGAEASGGGLGGWVEPSQINARQEPAAVERSFVGEGTARGYMSSLVRFMMHLFDNKKEHLTPSHLEQMEAENRKDSHNFRASQTSGTRSRKKNPSRCRENPRRELRAYIKRAILGIEPSRDGSPHNSPIKLEGEGALNYETVRDYMVSHFNVVEVDKDTAVKYLRAIGKADQIPDKISTGAGGKVRLEVYQSYSKFSGVRSAVGYIYKSSRVPMPEDMKKDIGIFINGVKRNVTAAKKILGLKITEGKEALSFEAYEFVAKKLFHSKEKRDVFNHLFLVLDWNLMKRAENCVDVMINHITFGSDCLKFEFAKSKTEQTGQLHGPWHVYANPKNPHICPVLALARYIFCYPEVLKGDVPLFDGTSQYGRYAARMRDLYLDLELDLDDMGIEAANLGSHSARKGVGSMVAAGCTVSPPIVSLCLRAGWKLGGVKDKYLFRENAGDMYVGRCASGHDVDSKEFAISQAYFDYSELNPEEEAKMKLRIKEHLRSRLPGSSTIPKSAWRLAHYCFAAICYSQKTLHEDLHDECPLRNAAVFRDIPEDITKFAQVRYSWNKTTKTPKLTGIPPHVVQLAKLERLERKVDSMEEKIMKRMKDEMDKRGFSSTEFKMSEIKECMGDVARLAVQGLIKETGLGKKARALAAEEVEDDEELASNGVEGFGFAMADEHEEWCNAQLALAQGESSELEHEDTEERRQLKSSRARAIAASSVKKRQLKVGYHHGTLNPLPVSWKFASMTSLQLVHNWFIGDLKRNIPPLRTLNSKNVAYLKGGNITRNKMKCFMRVVEAEARQKQVWVEKPSRWDYSAITQMWDAIKEDFLAKYGKTKRKKELAWTSVYTNMTKANAFGNRRNKAKNRG